MYNEGFHESRGCAYDDYPSPHGHRTTAMCDMSTPPPRCLLLGGHRRPQILYIGDGLAVLRPFHCAQQQQQQQQQQPRNAFHGVCWRIFGA